MGWFWADTTPAAAASQSSSMPPTHPPADASGAPPPGCPMHQRTVDAFNPHPKPPTPSQHQPPSSCPVSHGQGAHEKKQDPAQQSTLSKLNPLNYMFPDLSQDRAPHQTQALPTSREASTIPRGSGDGNWEYPSPQQMYNALLRKGYTDTDVTAVESMVSVHNFLNEGAWAEIVEWERRFGRGLGHGWQLCSQGEENANRLMAKSEAIDGAETAPTLLRFQGRPKEMTPKAAMIQTAAWLWPAKFGTEPPFDRHDWYVSRNYGGQQKQVRYVIDYYTGPPEPTGEPVFYLDVRPAATPMGSIERMIRWGGDVWWRASGGSARVASNENN